MGSTGDGNQHRRLPLVITNAAVVRTTPPYYRARDKKGGAFDLAKCSGVYATCKVCEWQSFMDLAKCRIHETLCKGKVKGKEVVNN